VPLVHHWCKPNTTQSRPSFHQGISDCLANSLHSHQFLVQDTHLFYYLYATPSLFGGAAALAFFAAVGAWTWLETDYGWAGKVASIVLSTVLMGNAFLCFILGASTWEEQEPHPENGGSVAATETTIRHPFYSSKTIITAVNNPDLSFSHTSRSILVGPCHIPPL